MLIEIPTEPYHRRLGRDRPGFLEHHVRCSETGVQISWPNRAHVAWEQRDTATGNLLSLKNRNRGLDEVVEDLSHLLMSDPSSQG